MADQGAKQTVYENDAWTLELEELGFDRQAKELAGMIVHCRPPFAITVRGRWGSGKTSVMRYAMARLGSQEDPIRLPLHTEDLKDQNYQDGRDALSRLTNEAATWLANFDCLPLERAYENDGVKGSEKTKARITCVWFSPWRYQNDPNPMVPLLHTLQHHFSLWSRTRESLDRVGRATVEAGLEILGHLADSAAGLLGFKTKAFSELPRAARGALERLDQERLVGPTDTERFNLLFEHAIGILLGVRGESDDKDGGGDRSNPNHRLVMFVDDLDRCEGQTAVRMLETIKLYLSTKHCVFVFGIDPTALECEVRNHWKDRPYGMACEYLEKMFQASVLIPTSDRYDRFIHKRLVERGWLEGAADGEPGEVAKSLARVLEPNPRKVKNFLNSLFVALETRRASFQPEDLLRFALIQRLKLTAPDTYRLLAQGRVEQHNTLRDFFGACVGDGLGDPPISKIGFRDLAVYVSDFGHIMRPNEREHAKVEKTDLLVRIDRIRADHELAKIWHKVGILNDYTTFCRLAGVEMEPAENQT